MADVRNVVDLLQLRAAERPDHVAYRFLADGELDSSAVTYAQQDSRARAIAATLLQKKVLGERALLLYPPTLDFISAFLGCLYSGAIAVPVYPPRSDRSLPRLASIAVDAQPRFILTTSSSLPTIKAWVSKLPAGERIDVIATDQIASAAASNWSRPEINPESLAFLQYTSGSTSAPKGVMVTHGNLLHNEEMILRAFAQSESSIIVSWLPLYHDMGLIGGVLQPLYLGAECVLMSPLAFVQKPVRWLQAITKYRATTSGGPNFAYDLCVAKIKEEEREKLDLSSWSVAFNGSEPVRAETLQGFSRTFAQCGFREEAFYPCYGLAEATLFVAGGNAASAAHFHAVDARGLQQGRAIAGTDQSSRRVVGCGRAWAEQQVLVVDPKQRTVCAAGEIGEIWVSGPSVAQGYWNRPEETARNFQIQLSDGAGDKNGALFLRTGDLGFQHGEELFVTGRIKDLIIVRGRNYYPQDLELTAECTHAALRPGSGAAFSIQDGDEERVVLVQEIDLPSPEPELRTVTGGIRSAISQEHELSLHDVMLIKAGTIPKTSSGKIQRHACKAKYLKDELQVIARDKSKGDLAAAETAPPAGELRRQELLLLGAKDRVMALERAIRTLSARALRIPYQNIAADQPLSTLGLDSLGAIELKHAVEETSGVSLSLAALLEGATVAQLAETVASEIEQASGIDEKIVPASVAPTKFPLSHGQKGLWFVQQIAPESSAYNIAVAARAIGPLDIPALQRAVQGLVHRHAALRTTFHRNAEGQPVQQAHDSMEVNVRFVETEGSTEAVAMHQLSQEAGLAFNLEQGPLFRVTALRRSQQEHLMLFALHHLCGDFWSFTIAFAELAQLYAQETGGAAANLPSTELRYSDYVAHQDRSLNGDRGAQLWRYWSEALPQPLPDLDLPTDHLRPALQTYRGGACGISFGIAITESLHRLSRSCGATLYMTLLAAFHVLLHRYTGQEQILVGSPVAGRSTSELAGLIGYFTNPLVMRLQVRSSATFREILEEVRHVVLGALENQDYPFPLLTERLRPARDPSRSPLFQAMFILQKAHRAELNALASFALGEPESEVQFGPLRFSSVELPERQVPFDLTLMMSQGETALRASLQYNRDLFEDATAERILRHFSTLLHGIGADPDQKIQSLPLLAEQDLTELREWNRTDSSYPREDLIHELFEAQVRCTPEATAVEDAKRTYSYAELDARANQLARHLKKLRVGQESIVAVCLERSVEIAVALLGVLKSGAAYLPLDPAFPENRTRFMLEDACVQIVIGEEALKSRFENQSCQVVLLDRDWEQITKESPDKIAERCDAHNLAYVIYTSGSTGLPKGVQISHQAVVNFLTSMVRSPGMTASDVLVSVTTISFDIFGLELYLPLIRGAKVVLASRETAMDGYALLELLKKCQATVMQATPATWQLLLTANKRGLPPMRAFCGGDILPPELVKELRANGCAVWNLYGPTETTIWSAVHEAISAASSTTGTMIGRPIANTQVYVIGSHLQPLPVGLPGELIIGGDGVARGYWQRPELTAERFVPDPLGNKVGGRLYRTGDLARRHADGEIEFLGRLDNQVKVRGHRIELGEIESVLSGCPGVQQAVVVARKQSGGDERLVAYLVPRAGAPAIFESNELKRFLSQSLPEAFLPSHFVTLEKLPLTPNGKVDRKALPNPQVSEKPDYVPPESGLERTIAGVWKQVLGTEKVGVHDSFFDLGGHSLLLAQVHSSLRQAGHEVSMIDLFRWPTIADLARHIGTSKPVATGVEAGLRVAGTRREADHRKSRDIAIIGMAGRFPRAANVEEFWKRISRGEECISFFSDQELQKLGIDQATLEDPSYVKAGGVLEGEDLFDAKFFGFNPREAELMDPQQRLFLECAWHALEDAGYDSDRYSGRIGVFAGAGLNTYLHQAASALGESSSLRYQAFIGNDKDFIATRVSYKLNLKGPSVAVQTACSTSLVAVHLACQSLLNGECDVAMAGAVGVRLSQREGYLYETGGILSPDGHCRAFDKKAGGTVIGSGMGAVVLKPLEGAIKKGDNIYAVIKGSAINNDGSHKIGYTAPSVEGQSAVIAEALSVAGIEPESVSYVETHGTGTTLGDPIEIEALSDVFRTKTDKKSFCAIGSVKTNIGHLDTAAGIAGLIKTVCALRYGQLPPSLNFNEPNPNIDFSTSPFFVNTRLTDWRKNGVPRRAGVSSFGIGGTNAHVVIEEAPRLGDDNSSSRPWKLLTLSAKTPSALDTLSGELAAALKANQDTELSDIAYTLQTGRRIFPHRRMVLCQDRSAAAAALETLNPEHVFTEASEGEPPQIAFLFPGQGSQYVNMGRGLYERERTFRQQIDSCAEILKNHFEPDIRQLLFPAEPTEQAALQLEQTAHTQPALFSFEYALARMWMEWGVFPQAMLGHSIGEYVAACLAGVISLEDALQLVTLRSRLMQSLPGGAMVGVRLPEAELAAFIVDGISVAALNSPSSCVVSGTAEAIGDLERMLERRNIAFSRLHASHAFHSGMMDSIIVDFVAAVRKVSLHSPRIPYISNVSGDWITDAQATGANYWGEHLRRTVRFADGIRQLTAGDGRILLECGPGYTLSTLARQQNSRAVAISSLPHASEVNTDSLTIVRALGKLWLKGIEINWDAFYANERRRRVPLPHYPFERQRYWIKSEELAKRKERNRALNEWLYVPCWQPSALVPADGLKVDSPILIFEDELGFTWRLAERLRKQGSVVAIARQGDSFVISDERTYLLNSGERAHYDALFDDLARSGALPRTIIHGWNLTAATSRPVLPSAWPDVRCRSFDSLIFLAQALETRVSESGIRINVLSNNMQKIGGEHVLQPEKAMLLGPVAVIPQEYPAVTCKSIDFLLPEFAVATENLIDDLLVEFGTPSDKQVAYRAGERWTRTFSPLPSSPKSELSVRLKDKGVYLITGGLGGVGLTFAEKLAREARAKLILTGRSDFPEKSDWGKWVVSDGEQDERTQIIQKLQAIEQIGAEILVVSADVADRDAMQTGLLKAEEHFGAIQGVIHAAGVPGAGIIQLKTPEMADAVLRPKVQGTLVLHSLLKNRRLDFFVLCSSINSIIGGFGQSDYSAANAFCDAFAQANFKHRGCYTVSINWDRWNEVGMAAKKFSGETWGLPRFVQQKTAANGHGAADMLLGTAVVETHEKKVHVAEFSPERQWVLSEHRIADRPMVPGTTYLEMARAAFARHAENHPVSIQQAVFPIPLIVNEGETRNVLTILAKTGETFSFRVVSKAGEHGVARTQWEEHARGEIAIANGTGKERQNYDLPQLLRNFETKGTVKTDSANRTPHHKFIATGPRWNVLRKLYVMGGQSFAELDLGERYAEDLAQYWLHPAMLDVATGFVHFLSEGDYLPLAYERITIWAPLPKEIFSYLRLRDDLKKESEVITSDISILDGSGSELVKIEGFSMKRVKEGAIALWQKPASHTESIEQGLQRNFTAGMSPKQGAEVFLRILTQGRTPQVTVSTRDLDEAMQEAVAFNRTRLLEELESLNSQQSTHERPAVSSSYMEPGDEVERRIAAIWQRVLGIDRVGIYDNFFELGGTSLNGVQLVAALKKELNVDIPLVSIFEASTVAALTKYLRPGSDRAVFERVQNRTERKKQVLAVNQRLRAGAGRER
jgi:amino acid adenylation domain-containing protein